MMIDRDVSVAHLIYFMKTLLSAIFRREVTVRLRPGYFPFVEPGFELDVQCLICGGPGCPVCKQSGWVELLPCGLVHPNVLRMSGIDPDQWGGFAFGLGLTRLAMMRYGDRRHSLVARRRSAIPDAILSASDEILIQLDSRTGSGARSAAAAADAPDHDEDRRVRGPGRSWRGVASRRFGGARGERRSDSGSHNRKAVVETARYGTKTVVCGAPNCRAGLLTAYVPAGVKIIDGIESDGMLASGAGAGHQSGSRRHRGAGGRRTAAFPTRSSKWITSRSRIGRICGDIMGWRAKWRPSRIVRCVIRCGWACSRPIRRPSASRLKT